MIRLAFRMLPLQEGAETAEDYRTGDHFLSYKSI